MMKKLGLLAVFLISGIVPLFSFAHPGRTASDGCHYCRTNCDKRGVAWNERHCHGRYTPTYTAPTVVKAKPVVKAIVKTKPVVKTAVKPKAVIKVAKKLTCKIGYVVSKTGKSCVKKK